MKIVVTSQSPIKIEACRQSFLRLGGTDDIEIIPLQAASYVNEQPFNDEAVTGVRNRIDDVRTLPEGTEQTLLTAQKHTPDADAWVSIQSGVFEENGDYIDRAVVAVMNKTGDIHIGYSDGVAFPREAVEETRRRGFDRWTVGRVLQDMGLVTRHDDPHADLPPYKSRQDYIVDALDKALKNIVNLGRPKILFGVCGIGNGHTFRQLPMIEHFAGIADMVIFAYADSYDFFTRKFANTTNVTVARVAVPFYANDRNGIDFNATAQKDSNRGVNFYAINAEAMRLAESRIGKPDLVVSDYEPTSADYAYAKGAKLVTIDQQSKYLVADFPGLLNGHGYANEIQMLRMFFPRANARLACSFFTAARKPDAIEDVEFYPPVLNEKIMDIHRAPSAQTSILIYLSAQQPFGQSVDDIAAVCASQPGVQFHVFGRNLATSGTRNMHVYEHGDARFHTILGQCHGIVSTAGHTLLSEAMHLGIPVYAIPLPLYEQQMNAKIIHDHGFGVSHPRFDADVLARFIGDLSAHAAAIENDTNILLRQPGQDLLIKRLESQLKPG